MKEKECKTIEKLRKDLDGMTERYEALKLEYESKLFFIKEQAASELAKTKKTQEAKIHKLKIELNEC